MKGMHQNGTFSNNGLLNYTYAYNLPNIGRIFTEESYGVKSSSLYLWTSTLSPPVIYEFIIDLFLNININKIYQNNIDPQRYIGVEHMTVNKKYIAQLLYDSKYMKQVIRIYFRNETNFSIGHINIVLKNFRSDASGFSFLSYDQNNMIFVRNPEKWEIYDIKDLELVFDTNEHSLQFSDYYGTNLSVSFLVLSEINPDIIKVEYFSIF